MQGIKGEGVRLQAEINKKSLHVKGKNIVKSQRNG